MAFEAIGGKRIALRPWKKSDAKQLQELANDKSIAMFTRVPYPYKMKNAGEFIKRSKAEGRSKKGFYFAIVLREEREIIGSISLMRIEKPSKKAEVGYWLGKKFRGKGFMQEALHLLLSFGFKKLKLNRIEINCSTKNKASRKVIEKAGAKFEGIARQDVVSGLGRINDSRVYSILSSEFREKVFK